MKFISRNTDYAVRALLSIMILTKNDKKVIVKVDDIIRLENLPERFLRKILKLLAKNNILSSYKGKDGGFSLKKSPDKIKFTDIINIFQGEIDITNCLLKGDICPNVIKCKLRKKLKEIGKSLNFKLSKITLKDLL